MPALPARDAEAALSGRQRGADRGNRGRRALAGRNRDRCAPASAPARRAGGDAGGCAAAATGRSAAAPSAASLPASASAPYSRARWRFRPRRLGRRCSGFCRCFGRDRRRLTRDSLAPVPAPTAAAPCAGRRRRRRRRRRTRRAIAGRRSGLAPERLPAAYRAPRRPRPLRRSRIGLGFRCPVAALALSQREGTAADVAPGDASVVFTAVLSINTAAPARRRAAISPTLSPARNQGKRGRSAPAAAGSPHGRSPRSTRAGRAADARQGALLTPRRCGSCRRTASAPAP